jgi:hypothetical protein
VALYHLYRHDAYQYGFWHGMSAGLKAELSEKIGSLEPSEKQIDVPELFQNSENDSRFREGFKSAYRMFLASRYAEGVVSAKSFRVARAFVNAGM